MGALGKSTTAVIVATSTMLAVGFVFSAIQPVYELTVLDMVISEPASVDQAIEALFWPALVFVLLSTVVTFGVGGYIAGRLAGRQAPKYVLLAVVIPLALAWSQVLTEPNPSVLGNALVSIVGVAVALTFSVYGGRKVADR